MTARSRSSFVHLWFVSLLWAVPIGYVLTAASVAVALTTGYATDGFDHPFSEYFSTALVGFFLWGTMVFVGLCYLIVPLVATVMAIVRLFAHRRRNQKCHD